MSRPSIMDMDLSGRIREIQIAEGRQKEPIIVAGPAGNPTQPRPLGRYSPEQFQIDQFTRPLAKCSTCGWMTGHAPGCMKAPPSAGDEQGFTGPGYGG